jgi:hypothetical protein
MKLFQASDIKVWGKTVAKPAILNGLTARCANECRVESGKRYRFLKRSRTLSGQLGTSFTTTTHPYLFSTTHEADVLVQDMSIPIDHLLGVCTFLVVLGGLLYLRVWMFQRFEAIATTRNEHLSQPNSQDLSDNQHFQLRRRSSSIEQYPF